MAKKRTPGRNRHLASTGCVLCHQGAKMVLFVTGLCNRSCWYCPLSRERRGNDVTFANDREVHSPGDIIREAEAMSALGTGITGGEPLLVLPRVTEYARLLKERFGPEHHIHLYTGVAPSEGDLRKMKGLIDEIRLHPPQEAWPEIFSTPYAASVQRAKELGFAVGIEVPSLPGLEHLAAILPQLDFLNINELEWGETNAPSMRERGLELEDSLHNAIRGAKGWARELAKQDRVHWCSSGFKDSVQLRERLKRIAANTARPFDDITDDGTVMYGVIEETERPYELVLSLGIDDYEVTPAGIELAWWILSESAEKIPDKKYIIERYPNNGMIVEVTPL